MTKILTFFSECDGLTETAFDNNIKMGYDTYPVGTYSPKGDSPLGIRDLLGNIYEWTQTIHIIHNSAYYNVKSLDELDELSTKYSSMKFISIIVGVSSEDIERLLLDNIPGDFTQSKRSIMYNSDHKSEFADLGFRCVFEGKNE